MAEDDETEPFDPQRILDALKRGTLEAEEVARHRPQPEQLAASLRDSALQLYEHLEHTRLISCSESGQDPTRTYAWIPRPGSIAAEDHNLFESDLVAFCEQKLPAQDLWLDTNPTRNPAHWGIEFLTRCIYTVVDDLLAVATLIQDGQRLRAPITLSRSVLEAAAVGCFLTDKQVQPKERLRRTLNLQLSQLKESANEVRDHEDEFNYEKELLELLEYAAFTDFAVPRYKPAGHQPPVIATPDGPRTDSARAMVDQVLPGGVGLTMWRSLSAVAHSRESGMVLPDQYSLPHKVQVWQRAKAVAWHTLPALLVTQELVRRLGPYLGWDCHDWLEGFEQVVQEWAIGGGQADTEIRRFLGFD